MKSGTLTIATIRAPPTSAFVRKRGAEPRLAKQRQADEGQRRARLPQDEKREEQGGAAEESAASAAGARRAIGSSVRATVRQTRLTPSSAAPAKSMSRGRGGAARRARRQTANAIGGRSAG